MTGEKGQFALALGDEMIERGAAVLRVMLGDIIGTDQELRDMAEGVLRGAFEAKDGPGAGGHVNQRRRSIPVGSRQRYETRSILLSAAATVMASQFHREVRPDPNDDAEADYNDEHLLIAARAYVEAHRANG